MDAAIQIDQSELLLQEGTPTLHVNETWMAPAYDATGGTPPKTTNPKSVINTEGQRQIFVIPPAQYKEMSQQECPASLAKIRT